MEGPRAETDSNNVATYQARLVNDSGAWSGTGREIGAWANDQSGGDWQDSELDTFWELGVAMWEPQSATPAPYPVSRHAEPTRCRAAGTRYRAVCPRHRVGYSS